MIDEIRQHVLEQCQKDTNRYPGAFDEHFVLMVERAKQLAEKLNADKEIVEIAAWLHDIGSIVYGTSENHHVTSSEYTEKLLKEKGYASDKIEKIKHCIIAHRGSQDVPRESVEAECVASADAMSHFDNIPSLFKLGLVIKGKNLDEAQEFVKGKLENSWNKLIPEAKEIIKDKYEAMKVLLD
ncbi:HD domain-containing protein [Candidatus Woesearchaeota archaeon]|nr:HD domain-containing protein [Candidatus Woesearchaeota archaeon]